MTEGFQLSPQQKRMWQLARAAGRDVPRTTIVIEVEGPADPDAVRRALEALVARHEILRTRLENLPGMALPVQVIDEAAAVRWTARDGGADVDAAVAAEAERQESDPGAGAVVRAAYVSGPGDSARLVLTLAGTSADLPSARLLVAQLAEEYGGTRPPDDGGEDESLQYADLSQWQDELLDSEEGEAGRSFWRSQLEPFSVPAVPGACARGDGTFDPRVVDVTLPGGIAGEVRALAGRLDVSVPSVLFAAWQILLARMTGQANAVIGIGSEGRTYEELASAIGPLAKLLPVRSVVDLAASFESRVTAAHDAISSAEDQQEFFAWDRVSDLLPGSPGAPLPVCFDSVRVGGPASADGVRFRLVADGESVNGALHRLALLGGVEPSVLRLTCVERDAALSVHLAYDRAALADGEAARIASRIAALLADAVSRPGAAVGELVIMDDAERRLVVEELSGRGTPSLAAAGETVVERIAGVAAERPDALAVVASDGPVTHADLRGRALAVAARLKAHGVGPGDFVGLCCARSTGMIVGILGVLEAGAAYVPLDPSYPRERLRFMLADAKVRVVLVGDGLEQVAAADGVDALPLESPAGPEPAGARSAIRPENPAYVIYTSGSTGQPKGVVVTHANLAHSTAARLAYYAEPVERYLLLPSFAFDSSVAGIFWTLAQGGALVLPDEGTERDPHRITGMIAEHGVTHLLGLPSMLALLHAENRPERLEGLRVAIVAGEECPPDLVARHREALPGTALYNEYGPTEATVWSTVHDCLSTDPGASVPIGRPIAGTFAHVLEPGRAPAPVGVSGELAIGGAGVAAGYLRRDDLTREKFVADPFGGSGRLYLTGDLARVRADGLFEFHGRIDEQVKIRGYRIELGEIEARLREHPALAEAVVVARDDASGPKRLVAYVVREGDGTPAVGALREFLGATLPDYMLPSAFVPIPRVPLSPNGKVDRAALPDPDDARPELEAAYVAPRTDLERLLSESWGEALGLEKVGVDDDFFELGGNSIQAAVLVNKLQTLLGEYLHVATLFRHASIAKLAVYLQEHYAEAIAAHVDGVTGSSAGAHAVVVDEARVDEIRSIVEPLPEYVATDAPGPNPRTVFIFCPPRSGSTLLRVMLAGHEALFVPPEIELLNFNTMRERDAAFTGPEQFLGEGLIRAIMALRGCDADGAQAVVREMLESDASTKAMYRSLQQWAGDRVLVDKTACYSLDERILSRGESEFQDAFYIHLLRHPHGMIHSFEKVRLEQVFFRFPHSYGRRTLAELVWNLSHRNILAALSRVPDERKMTLRFEDLLESPEREMRRASERLGLDYRPDMLEPYSEPKMRMLDGTSEHSKMQGDPRFHEHSGINRSVADAWRTSVDEDFLSDVTWAQAAAFGYERDAARRPAAAAAALPADVEGMSDEDVRTMLEQMMTEEDGAS